MLIRKSTTADLQRMLELFEDARQYMKENGNPTQWKDSWPPRELIENDIANGKSYVCEDGKKIVGTFFFSTDPDPTYKVIYNGAWLKDCKYGVVHRITTDRNTKGVGSFILKWAYSQAGSLRIDTHENNLPMQGLLAKEGFSYCGIIILANGEPRNAYQKI